MAGLVAIAAGALMPNVSSALVTVCSKIESLLASAASHWRTRRNAPSACNAFRPAFR